MEAKGMTTKKIVQTGILLALCLVFQLLKGISVYITGPRVNAILILASLSCGWYSGVLIAVVAPLTAMLIGATPIVNAVPAMLPVIMIGNALIAVSAWLFRNRMLPLGLAIGSCLKAGFLWLTVWYVVLPVFGSGVPEKMQMAAKATFSVTQLITAAIGSVIAWLVWTRLKKYLATEA